MATAPLTACVCIEAARASKIGSVSLIARTSLALSRARLTLAPQRHQRPAQPGLLLHPRHRVHEAAKTDGADRTMQTLGIDELERAAVELRRDREDLFDLKVFSHEFG